MRYRPRLGERTGTVLWRRIRVRSRSEQRLQPILPELRQGPGPKEITQQTVTERQPRQIHQLQ